MGACLNGSAEIYIGIGLLPENHSPRSTCFFYSGLLHSGGGGYMV
jgi:hypothetical protein